jgi:hypothetical protein
MGCPMTRCADVRMPPILEETVALTGQQTVARQQSFGPDCARIQRFI